MSLRRSGVRTVAHLAARHRRAVSDGENGRILVLGIGFAVVLLALILVVASVSAIHLDRKRALALADAAAAAVADSVSEDGFYGDGDRLLTDEMVRAELEAYLAEVDRSGMDRVTSFAVGEPTGVEGEDTAVVTFVVTIDPPFVPALVADVVGPVELTVTGRARAFEPGAAAP